MGETKTPIENLAAMVARGFESVHSQIGRLRTEMLAGFDAIDGELADIKDQIRELRRDVRQLQDMSVPPEEYQSVLRRLSRLEDKLGLPHEIERELSPA